jgi:hypothetical protein
VNRVAKHREATLEIDIPERLPELVLRALRYVVDQNIQLSLLRANPRDYFLHSINVQMIDNNRDSVAATLRYKFSRLFDRFGTLRVVFRGP